MMLPVNVVNSASPLSVEAVTSVANVIVAVAALAVGFVSILLARATLRTQIHHNKLSVRPIPYFTVADYENKILVAVRNNGSGPLIVQRIWVSDGKTEKDDLIGWMPPHPETVLWSHFSSVLAGRSISPGNEVVLINLNGDPERHLFVEYRDLCRSVLGNLTANIQYTDIYGDSFAPVSRELNWFRRENPK